MQVVVPQRCTILLVAVSFLAIVAVFLQTRTKSRLGPKFLNAAMTAATSDRSDHSTSSTPTLTAFLGRLITLADQLPDTVKPFSCVTAKNSGMSFPICVYGATEDVWISKSFIHGGYFEGGTVSRVVRLFRRYPDLEFVDLGANIGTFTLPVSRITHVVAVEPYVKTVARLFKSVQLGRVANNVSLVFNAISNERSTYVLGHYQGNVGGTYLKVAKTTGCTGRLDCVAESNQSSTQTILLNDLLPLMRGRRAVLKVDVEGHQPEVFTEASAGRFFELIDIPLVYMEWNNLCRRRNISAQVQDLLRFFSARQYHVFSENNLQMGPNCSRWTSNIVIRKLSAEF